MMSKPKYIVILTGLFMKHNGKRYFALLLVFFFVNILARVDFGMKTWQAKPRPKALLRSIKNANTYLEDLKAFTVKALRV